MKLSLLSAWVTCVLFVTWPQALLLAATVPTKDQFVRYALLHEGDLVHGKALFADEQRVACSRCHTVDGTAAKAGPDLFAVGDKFGRREIIEAVLWPSKSIATGYSTTTITTTLGDEYTGILKQVTDTGVVLLGADAVPIRLANRDIASQRTGDVSFMPEGLEMGLSLSDFTDLIEYLVSLKQPENATSVYQGMPNNIEPLARPVALRPFFEAALQFEHPVWFGQVPGDCDTFMVVEHETGKIWRLHRTAPSSPLGSTQERNRTLAFEKSLFLDTGVYAKGTRGLLGLAFHLSFHDNGRYFIAKHTVENGHFATLILEGQARVDRAADSGAALRLILKLDAATNVHYGGGLAFGPDGFFYIGMGDTGPQEDPQGHGQNTTLFLGKMLRIDVNRRTAEKNYVVPVDNPFVGRPEFRPEIWAYGFREPWRFSFDSVTGELWVGDVGQDRYEEVDLVRREENYGWNVYEGFEPFSNAYRRPGEVYIPPVFAYRRKYGPSVTGGFVYRGDRHSSFYGVYICGDYESRRLFGLTQENRLLKTVREIGRASERVVSFGCDQAGNIYVVGYEGTIFQLDFSSSRFE